MDGLRIGIIGGGQLGKLLVEKGFISNQNNIRIYSPELPLCHPSWYTQWVQGRLDDFDNLVKFGCNCDILTYEIESVNVEALYEIEKMGKRVVPSPSVLEIVQNKALQKTFLADNGFPVPEFYDYRTREELMSNDLLTSWMEFEFAKHEGHGCIINKTQEGGYDGYGVQKIIPQNLEKIFPKKGLLERCVEIDKELSVIVVRKVRKEYVIGKEGYIEKYVEDVETFPITEMVMDENHKLKYSISPARISDGVKDMCDQLARKIAQVIGLEGIMAVEFFLDVGGEIFVNELAPRPHNSGHQTIELCNVDQYSMLASIVSNNNCPLLKIRIVDSMKDRITVLENIIGTGRGGGFRNPRLSFEYEMSGAHRLGIDRNDIHLYDYRKEMCQPGRKLGHVVACVGQDKLDDWIRELELCYSSSISRVRIERPRVGVIMGSQSDFHVVEDCIDILQEFGVHYDVRVVSAHRTPHQMIEYGSSAHERGFDVIVCAAGGAAHLPGMIASCSLCPVIGIPVKSSNSIDGWDSLLSIAQMPGGIPVATMALNGAKNAGLMAIRILAISDDGLYRQLEKYRASLEEKVRNQNHEMRVKELRGEL